MDKGFLDAKMRAQLSAVFSKFQQPVVVTATLANDHAARELREFAEELKGIHPNVQVETVTQSDAELSHLALHRKGEKANVRYYSVPGGHEFNSFVIALYNLAGPGQAVAETVTARAKKLAAHRIQVMTTLSCTNCPEVVMATQKLAAIAENLEAEMYDVSKFPAWKEKYRIMAVPCMILDGESTFFGKKNIEEILEILENA